MCLPLLWQSYSEFMPKYIMKETYDDCNNYGRPKGLPTLTSIEIKR